MPTASNWASHPADCCAPVALATADRDRASELALLAKALADPFRAQIVEVLRNRDEVCVNRMQDSFFLSQASISYHLGVLRRAGIIESERRGKLVYYRLARDPARELGEWISGLQA